MKSPRLARLMCSVLLWAPTASAQSEESAPCSATVTGKCNATVCGNHSSATVICDPWIPPTWLVGLSAAVGVVGLGVASGIAIHAQSEQNAQLRLDPFARSQGVKDSIQSQAVATDVLFPASGLFVAASLILLVIRLNAPEAKPSDLPQPAAWAVPGADGAGLSGRW
jgi:hypothetical protein